MGGVLSVPFWNAVDDRTVTPSLLAERWMQTHQTTVCKPDEALSFLTSVAADLKLFKKEVQINNILLECVDVDGNFHFGDLIIVFHEAINNRGTKADSDLYADLRRLRNYTQEPEETRNPLIEGLSMSQQHLAAASDSELGTELRQEARSSGSYFSLLHRDLLNNVYSYAQMSQIFIPQTGLRKRWEATDLALLDADATFHIREKHCIAFQDPLSSTHNLNRSLYLRALSLDDGACVWQSAPIRVATNNGRRSLCVSQSGYVFACPQPDKLFVYLPPYRNAVRTFALTNGATTVAPLVRAVGRDVFLLFDFGTRYEISSVLGLETSNFTAWSLSPPVVMRNPYQSEETVRFTLTTTETHGTVAMVHSFYFMLVAFLSQPDRPHTTLQLNREQHPNPLIVGASLVYADVGAVIVYFLDDLSKPLKRISMLPSPTERGFIRLGRLPFARVGAFYSSPCQNNAFMSLSLDADDVTVTDMSSVEIRTSFPCWLLNGDVLLIESCGQVNWVSLRTGKALRAPQQISTSSTSLNTMYTIGDSLFTIGLSRLVCWEAPLRGSTKRA